MDEDPWAGLERSPSDQAFRGHLISAARPWELFRALSPAGNRVLFMVHDARSSPSGRLPAIAGIALSIRERLHDGKRILALRLEEGEYADIFAKFCDDIAETVAGASTEALAVRAIIDQAARWQALLRGARREVLGPQAQLGLIGELRLLLDTLAPMTGLHAAVGSWRGPSGYPKDFELPATCIECKARTASGKGTVRITSEDQLTDEPGHSLLLHVSTFACADSTVSGAVNLHGAVARVRKAVDLTAAFARSRLDEGLDTVGYDGAHSYDFWWLHVGTAWHEVRDGFPRIVPGMYPEGPSGLSYDLSLSSIRAHAVSDDRAGQLIRAGGRIA
ncbi:putative PD-(D/E)XK family protein DUF4420 [Hasllibacter halocynthiae]|uniref:Putative PD-(D/E)XK family protein DUF4420 n=1 Tax=Hasllibacter halocynthiae TaxID=595589 RepID=A0A2T0X1K1_9RHOB|nr:PD-(D/E)XK motif protein [Hasllibacter halocynthiae]PRY92822.1 putative PD-(D/E)XK family protein DUF4420 [Hasllibacter halocynthiae]